jgi:hypothetical protein
MMIFVKRNPQGEVVAVGYERPDDDNSGWTDANGDEPEVRAFARALAAADPMGASDLGLVRVLEDVIGLLVERAVIRFTDLPLAAQAKLLERRGAREAIHRLSLLDDDGLI